MPQSMITSPEQYVSLNQQAISVAILSFVCADRVPDQAPLWPHQLPVLPGSELCTCEPPLTPFCWHSTGKCSKIPYLAEAT